MRCTNCNGTKCEACIVHYNAKPYNEALAKQIKETNSWYDYASEAHHIHMLSKMLYMDNPTTELQYMVEQSAIAVDQAWAAAEDAANTLRQM